jgi:hypothetical protein
VKTNERLVAIGIALVSASLLGYELTQVRIFAYTLHPVIAFAAIAIAMLGFGIGATPASAVLFPLAPGVTGYNAQFARWERQQGYAAPVVEFDEWDPVGRLEVLRHARDTIRVPEEIGFRVLPVDGGAMTLLLEEPRSAPAPARSPASRSRRAPCAR